MPTTDISTANVFQPSELLNIFKSYLAAQSVNRNVICVRGIYLMSSHVYGRLAYDKIRTENSVEELTIVIPLALREKLKNGNLVSVYGTIDRKVLPNGSIQLLLNASRVDKEQEAVVNEDDLKREQFRRIKSENGFKNVDAILENKLFLDERPQVALIYADGSITDADFAKGLDAAKAAIDFQEFRVSFANAQAVSDTLKSLDTPQHDVIAIVRGGGSGLDKLDDLAIVEALAHLNTAWIYAIGHEKETLFIRNIADKVMPIPHALGTYFRDTVESVAQKRNNSRAVLVKEVEGQFKKQIEDANKKNEQLNKQLEALQKQAKEQSEQSAKQIADLTKAQKEHQEQIKKASEESRRQFQQQLEAFKKTTENTQASLQRSFDRQLQESKDTIEKLNQKNAYLSRLAYDAPSEYWKYFTIIFATIAAILAIAAFS